MRFLREGSSRWSCRPGRIPGPAGRRPGFLSTPFRVPAGPIGRPPSGSLAGREEQFAPGGADSSASGASPTAPYSAPGAPPSPRAAPPKVADRSRRLGLRFRDPAPKEALESFRFRGFEIAFDEREVRPEHHALVFTVAGAMDLDLLCDFRAAIDRALAEGRTLRRFQRELAPLLRKKGWWGKKERKDPVTGKTVRVRLGSYRRLRTIYRANLRAALAAGEWARARRAEKTRPYLLYEPGPGRKRCDRHRAWAGTLLPVAHPWWDDHFPPNGGDCRCRVRQVGEAETRRRGGVTEPPPRREVEWKNERTGEVRRLDRGLDPAWATNPGKYRERLLTGLHHGAADTADRELARAAHRSLIRSPLLDDFHRQVADYGRRHPEEAKAERVEIRDRTFRERLGDFWIALLGDRERRALPDPTGAGRPTRLVRLSPDTALKQSARHPDLGAADYRLLPELIEHGEMAVNEDGTHLAFLRRFDGHWYYAVVKQTRHDELFLKTFHKVKDRDLARATRRSSAASGVNAR